MNIRRSVRSICIAVVLAACFSIAAMATPEGKSYEVEFTIDFTAAEGSPNAMIRIGRGAERFRELRMDFDPDRFQDFTADGMLDVTADSLSWRPPAQGGSLQYRARIEHQRRGDGYDARFTDEWALFRGNDVFPTATTRVLKGSVSDSRLRLILPAGWSDVTRYEADGDAAYFVANEGRGFARPSGWMLVGELGVRRDLIADRRVAIAAPVGESFHRMDVMAFLNWTLPGVAALFPTLDERLLIVGAGDPMWRGGLSGPGSLFIHAERPLISENGTSTFLHELIHVAMGVSGSRHDDWIVEGLAEYYSIELLRRSGTLSERRSARSFASLADWGSQVDDLFVPRATGAVTARAVTLLAALANELATRAGTTVGLDDIVRELIDGGGVYSYRALCRAVTARTGKPAMTLLPERVPGAEPLAECLAP